MAKVSILIVEDEQLVADNLRRRLVGLGYDVLGIFNSGEAAVQSISELKPDLILMDVELGGVLDGVETADQIKSLRSVPIIYMTAFSDDLTLQRAKITEPFGYLLKPFDTDVLHITIEMAVYKYAMEQKLHLAYAELERWVEERSQASNQLKEETADRAQLEQALHLAEASLSVLLDAIPDAVLYIAQDGSVRRANQPAKTLFSYTCQELLNSRVDLLLGIDLKEWRARFDGKQPAMPGKLDGMVKTSPEGSVSVTMELYPVFVDENRLAIGVIRSHAVQE
jgi:two-component system, response regulator PdtaR